MFILEMLSALDCVTLVECVVVVPFAGLLRGVPGSGGAEDGGATPPEGSAPCREELLSELEESRMRCSELEEKCAQHKKSRKKFKKKLKKLAS